MSSSEFPLASPLLSPASATGSAVLFGGFPDVGSEEAHPKVLASVRRSNRACSFPAHGFHDNAADGCGVKEGISAIKLTSPHSPRSRRVGSSFHPAQRHRLW